ncbi:MAG: hypothetical protein M3Q10_08085 [Chloroflexota bacterium]|nr:hypothetical protein [Chloroflexota bacterium]
MADLSALLAIPLDPDERAVYRCVAARGSIIVITTKRLITLGGTLPTVAVPLRAIHHCFVRRRGVFAWRYAVVGVTADGRLQTWVGCADKDQCVRIASAVQAARLQGAWGR